MKIAQTQLQQMYMELVKEDSTVMERRTNTDSQRVQEDALLDQALLEREGQLEKLGSAVAESDAKANELEFANAEMERERAEVLHQLDQSFRQQQNAEISGPDVNSLVQVEAELTARMQENEMLREELKRLSVVESDMRTQSAKSILRLNEEAEHYKLACSNTSVGGRVGTPPRGP